MPAVFEDRRADELMAVDRSHWWFRGKAALVATALARTGGARGFLADVGAGAGGVTAMVGWDPERLVVLEAGDVLVRHARHGHGLPAVRALAVPLPLADGSVDVVCLLDVLEHLAEPTEALAEAARVLRPDGRIVLNVPGHRWLWSPADVHLGHRRRYDRRLVRRELAGVGFEPVLSTHVFSWLVPPVLVERRVLRRRGPALGLDRAGFVVDRAAMVLTTVERLLLGRVVGAVRHVDPLRGQATYEAAFSSWYSSSTLTAQMSWSRAEDVLDGEHGREHRVVLVVVLVHAVAARRGARWGRARRATSRRTLDVVLVVLVVDGIRLRHPHDVAGLDLAGVDEAEDGRAPRLPSSTRSSSAIVHSSSPSNTKYSRPRQVRPSLTRYGDHEPKFWMRPTLTSGSWM